MADTGVQTQQPEQKQETKRKVKRVEWHVLPKSMSGGPHGIGDPKDQTLRETELTVLIPNMMKEQIKSTHCQPAIRSFEDCARKERFMMPFNCRPERDVLRDCMELWLGNEDIRKECTEKYLAKRTKYRETGIGEPMKKKHSNMV